MGTIHRTKPIFFIVKIRKKAVSRGAHNAYTRTLDRHYKIK